MILGSAAGIGVLCTLVVLFFDPFFFVLAGGGDDGGCGACELASATLVRKAANSVPRLQVSVPVKVQKKVDAYQFVLRRFALAEPGVPLQVSTHVFAIEEQPRQY